MQFQGLTLDKFQEESIHAINNHLSVLVSAPTGSGKTLIADYIISKFLKKTTKDGAKRVIYTAPIKALSNQKFKDFTSQYGDDKIGLITGDIVINPNAQILIMTTEVYRNMAIMNDALLTQTSYCIMDEIHFISDEQRGYIWEESIIFSPKHMRFLFLSATIPNAKEFAGWVSSIKEHPVNIVRSNKRAVPLKRRFFDYELGITTLNKIKERKEFDKLPEFRKGRVYRRQKIPAPDFRDLIAELTGKMPCIYFVFSRKKTQEFATSLARKRSFVNRTQRLEISNISTEEFRKVSRDVLNLPTTIQLRNCIAKGIAFHHAGMLPGLKNVVEHLFAKGLIKVLFATETFAVGINMPAKTVCFDSLRKFTGNGFRYLNSKEYFQISGRAGRRGIDKEGLSVAMIHRPSANIEQIQRFTSKDILPILSQFQMKPNTVLNMINLHSEKEIKKLLLMNFFTYQKLKGKKSKRVFGSIKARFTKLKKMLEKLGYIDDGKLTEKGLFATNIYANEIDITEIFHGFNLNEEKILTLVMAICYEGRRGTRFYNAQSSWTIGLIREISDHPIIGKRSWIKNIEKISAITHPVYNGKKFVEILKNTNLPEGDLIRLLLQVTDRLIQVEKAHSDYKIIAKIRNTKDIIRSCLEGIHTL